MPIREDVLREKTFKDDEVMIDGRVYRTLTRTDAELSAVSNEKMNVHRNSLAIGRLFKHLCDKRLLSAAELDDILFDVAVH